MENVEGKTAFITGGASGMGLGMAKVFLKAGMNVVIADVREDALKEAVAELGGSNRVYSGQARRHRPRGLGAGGRRGGEGLRPGARAGSTTPAWAWSAT